MWSERYEVLVGYHKKRFGTDKITAVGTDAIMSVDGDNFHISMFADGVIESDTLKLHDGNDDSEHGEQFRRV